MAPAWKVLMTAVPRLRQLAAMLRRGSPVAMSAALSPAARAAPSRSATAPTTRDSRARQAHPLGGLVHAPRRASDAPRAARGGGAAPAVVRAPRRVAAGSAGAGSARARRSVDASLSVRRDSIRCDSSLLPEIRSEVSRPIDRSVRSLSLDRSIDRAAPRAASSRRWRPSTRTSPREPRPRARRAERARRRGARACRDDVSSCQGAASAPPRRNGRDTSDKKKRN